MQDGDTTQAHLADSLELKGFFLRHSFGKIKAFSLKKNIYIQRIEKIKVNFFSTSKLKPTFIFHTDHL